MNKEQGNLTSMRNRRGTTLNIFAKRRQASHRQSMARRENKRLTQDDFSIGQGEFVGLREKIVEQIARA